MREKVKTNVIIVRVSNKEKEELNNLAKQNNMCLSEYLRFVGLNSKIKVSIG